MKNLLRVLVMALLAGALLSACAGQANNLIGSWRTTTTAATAAQPSVTLEFRQDGHLLEASQGMTQDIIYEISADKNDTLLIKPTKDTPASQASSIGFAITGDTLTLTISGAPQKFTRLK
jgi:hypothetical protein